MQNKPHLTPDFTRASLLLRLKHDGPAREIVWTEFYDLYAPVIAGFARRIGANSAEVDDLVQEVLRAFFAASPEFTYDPSKGRFRGYLKACVWNKMGNIRRQNARDRAVVEYFQNNQETEEIWNDVWETEKLHRALSATGERYATNPQRQRTFRAFEMCTLLDRSTKQVAEELGMSFENVRAAKSRVGKALREEFERLDMTIG